MWLQITDQRGEFSGKLVSTADIVYFSAAYKPVQCTQTANGFVLVPKSSHSTFASSRICGYSSVGRYVGSPFHLRFHTFFHLLCSSCIHTFFTVLSNPTLLSFLLKMFFDTCSNAVADRRQSICFGLVGPRQCNVAYNSLCVDSFIAGELAPS